MDTSIIAVPTVLATAVAGGAATVITVLWYEVRAQFKARAKDTKTMIEAVDSLRGETAALRADVGALVDLFRESLGRPARTRIPTGRAG